MGHITTKRNFLKFYIALGVCFLLFLFMGTALVWISFKPDSETTTTGTIALRSFGVAIYVLDLYSVYRYFKNVPSAAVNFEGISIGKRNYYWSDIKDITLTGKQPFRYLFNWPMEGAKLTLNDGGKLYLFDDMYSNLWQVKLFLQEVAVNKSKTFELPNTTISRSELESEVFDTFKGKLLFSLRGITCWGMIVFFAALLIHDRNAPNTGLIAFIFVFAMFWLLLHSLLLYYFRVSENFLIVRNHILFWKNKPYRLKDIKEVAFETQGKMPNCLRVITKDFRTWLFPAGTLRDKTWLRLKDTLESRGIIVRNECIYQELPTKEESAAQ